MLKHAFVLVSSLVLFACADAGAPVASDLPAEAETADAAATFATKGGDFRFVLDESEVLADVEKKCADAAEPTACMKEIRATAAEEGLEFIPLDNGRVRFVSYGVENGERAIYVDAELTLVPLGDGIVHMIPERLLAGKAPPEGVKLLLEVVDGDVIAMDKRGGHPRTGGKRLVYHRRAR